MGGDADVDPDIAALTARVDEQIAAAQRNADQMQAWAAEVDAVTGEGTALRGAVRVTVNNSGVATGVRITDEGCEAGGRALSAAVMEAMGAAQQAVGDVVARSAAARFGEDGEITRLMVADLSQRLGVDIDVSEPPTGSRPYGRRGPRGPEEGVIG